MTVRCSPRMRCVRGPRASILSRMWSSSSSVTPGRVMMIMVFSALSDGLLGDRPRKKAPDQESRASGQNAIALSARASVAGSRRGPARKVESLISLRVIHGLQAVLPATMSQETVWSVAPGVHRFRHKIRPSGTSFSRWRIHTSPRSLRVRSPRSRRGFRAPSSMKSTCPSGSAYAFVDCFLEGAGGNRAGRSEWRR